MMDYRQSRSWICGFRAVGRYHEIGINYRIAARGQQTRRFVFILFQSDLSEANTRVSFDLGIRASQQSLIFLCNVKWEPTKCKEQRKWWRWKKKRLPERREKCGLSRPDCCGWQKNKTPSCCCWISWNMSMGFVVVFRFRVVGQIEKRSITGFVFRHFRSIAISQTVSFLFR